jgi:hypothetical protein
VANIGKYRPLTKSHIWPAALGKFTVLDATRHFQVSEVYHTVKKPVNLEQDPDQSGGVPALDEPLSDKAKKRRFDLICDADVRDLAIDAAESIQAQNSIEFMLAHQVAAAHKMAMHFMASAQEDLSAYINSGHEFPHRSIEAARMAATAARLMDTCQRGALTLDRIRNGGQQTMTIQHVNVTEGGQAVVAGTVENQRGRKRRGPSDDDQGTR